MTASGYDSAFFAAQADESLRSARVVLPVVLSLINPTSAIDVGCGVGAWLKVLSENGVTDYVGLDGEYVDPDQLLIPPSRFKPVDLSAPLASLGRTFDLAVCLEVGEHLVPSAVTGLIARLTECSPVVLFSAAVPGQGGTHHVNEQWPHYWRELFDKHNFHRLDAIRPRIWQNPNVEWWYKQNIYLYCHRDHVISNPALKREADLSANCPFELLHVDILGPLTRREERVRAIPQWVRKSVRGLRW